MITNHFNKMIRIRKEAEQMRRQMAAKWGVPLSGVQVHLYWKEWTDGDEKHRGSLRWGVNFYFDHENIHIIGGKVPLALPNACPTWPPFGSEGLDAY